MSNRYREEMCRGEGDEGRGRGRGMKEKKNEERRKDGKALR